ncbi:50S ribosomal protein L18Ae [Halopenitus sp. H-Gu1]|uniref:50S ribosomal protein L18Ae n=1 Tax=Halopenitus sp. H-Gu1 TaxID=3242697 RepID=UPI00359E2CD5
MSHFTASGWFKTRHGSQEFTKTIEAPNEDVAREHIFSKVGSQHGVKRSEMELNALTETEEVEA